MTYEQAQRILDNIPTQRQMGIDLAKKAIQAGIQDKVANDTNLDKIFGKEIEAGFFEYYNAWKILENNK